MTATGLNETLFLHINAAAGTPDWMIKTACFIAADLVVLLPLFLIALWLTGDKEKRAAGIQTVLVIVASLVISKIVALIYPHPRPFMIGLGHQFLPHAPNASFPSDHATFFAAAAFALLVGRCYALGVITFIIGAAVSWARIYVGIHFPLDMAGALGVAALGQLAVYPFWRKFGAVITAYAEKLYRVIFKPFIARGWLRN